jgi:hypothetical protein
MNNWHGMKARIGLRRLYYLLHYDPTTGVFRWNVDRNNRYRAGSIAGTNRDGYRYVMINRENYGAARLAWLYMTGEEPRDDVGFANGNPLDLCWANLHAIACTVHALKRQDWALACARGYYKELHYSGRRGGLTPYRVEVHCDGRQCYVGSFPTSDDAQCAFWFARLLIREAEHLELAPS